MVSIARVVFQGCADKEQSNSILCQLKLLILKKQFARKKKKMHFREVHQEKKISDIQIQAIKYFLWLSCNPWVMFSKGLE